MEYNEKRKTDLLRYSHLIYLLNILRKKELVTADEYHAIKEHIMKKYHIISDWLA